MGGCAAPGDAFGRGLERLMLALLKEYWEQRTLVWVLTRRSLIGRYRGTAMGFLWTFVHPLLLFSVYALVFGVFVRLEVEDYPAFLLSGLLPWTWFASCLAIGSTATLGDAGWIRQAAFSPAIPPLVTCLATLINFLLELPVLVGILLALGRPLSGWALALPLVVGVQFVLLLGLTLACSALSVRYRDVVQLVQAVLPMWFFMTPVVYPLDFVPEGFRWLLALNPMAHLVEAYQALLFRGLPPALHHMGIAAGGALVAFALGAMVLASLRDRIPEEL
jgi:ABC-type polysaccharide/polyol phosphate export permease